MSEVTIWDQLDLAGKFIAAEIKLARKYEASVKDKVETDLKKADDHWVAAAQRLAEARKLCAEAKHSFKEFKKKWAPDLSRTTLYRVIGIGSGKLTIEDQRKEWREEKREKRAAAKVSRTSRLSRTEGLSSGTDDQIKKTDAVSDAAQKQVDNVIAKLPPSWCQAQGEITPDEMKAKLAALDEPAPTPTLVPEAGPEPVAPEEMAPPTAPSPETPCDEPDTFWKQLCAAFGNIQVLLQQELSWPELSANKKRRRGKALDQFESIRAELLALAEEPRKAKVAA